MCKLCKYVIIKNGVLCVLETDRMKEVIRNELGVFDYRDYIFDDDPSVYILCKGFKYMILIILLFIDLFQMMLTVILMETVIFTKMDDFWLLQITLMQ